MKFRIDMSRSCIALFLVAALHGCAEGVPWSAQEKENAAHIEASLRATSDAAVLFNEIDTPAAYRARRDDLLRTLRAAHLHAVQVNESVLEKLHPQLYARFRLDYQKALARMITAYEADDLDAAAIAAGDVRDFMLWYRENRHLFRWWDEAM